MRQKKTALVAFWTTPARSALYRQLAEEAGKSLSEWLRETVERAARQALDEQAA